jgi:hypothetical protein
MHRGRIMFPVTVRVGIFIFYWKAVKIFADHGDVSVVQSIK